MQCVLLNFSETLGCLFKFCVNVLVFSLENMNFSRDAAVVPKLCGIFIFSFTSLIIGLLPIVIHSHYKHMPNSSQSSERKAKYKRLLAHMSAFGGGVLLSTTFLHLLPEIRKSVEMMGQKHIFSYKDSVQLPELLMCLGFLFLYLIEEVAHKIISSRSKLNIEMACGEHIVNVYESSIEVPVTIQELNEGDQPHGLNGNSAEACGKTISESKCSNGNGMRNSVRCSERIPCPDTSTIFFTESSSKNFLLIFALSIHEGFEGLAIGLERQPDAVWYMVLGVGSHKAVIAFCIGIQMLSSKLDRKVAIIYVLVFATATSLGVAVGLFLYMESGIFSVILQGLATGTLLHVVFFELLKPHSEQTPFTGVFLGFLSMAVLKYFSP